MLALSRAHGKADQARNLAQEELYRAQQALASLKVKYTEEQRSAARLDGNAKNLFQELQQSKDRLAQTRAEKDAALKTVEERDQLVSELQQQNANLDRAVTEKYSEIAALRANRNDPRGQ